MTPMSNHFEDGHPVMVDVAHKEESARRAVAESFVRLPPDALEAVRNRTVDKGDAVAVAELAGIMAAKKTSDLIPLCHPLPLSSVRVHGTLTDGGVRFEASCKTTARTGVEMEALTAVTVAALTLYDMLKGVSKAIEIGPIRLLSKDGGTSGRWQR